MTRRTLVVIMVAALGLTLTIPAWSGDSADPAAKRPDKSVPRNDSTGDRAAHQETPRDPYLPTPRQPAAPRAAAPTSRDGHVSVQVNVDEFGNNIVGDAANEPSIAIDPTDLTRMAIGWRQFDNIASDFRQAGWGFTDDGGFSWTFPGAIEPGIFRSDPVLDADADGNFFYNSLTKDSSSNYWCNVYKSTDGGASWDAGVYAHGGDKQWQVIDTTNGIGRGNIYATWNSSFSSCAGNFTRSYDNGLTFEPCTTVLGDPYWGVLAVGPDGELYVSGTGMTIAKSTTMQDSALSAAWDFSGSVNLDGSLQFSAGPNPAGLLGQNWVAVDHSNGPTRGNVYMLASVARSSTTDPLDVMFARSTDGGANWSPPVRVNDDPGDAAWQWFGTMSVAPNGRIDAVWLDTRNDPGGYLSELYYSYSTDAGVTWSPNEALSAAFDPHVGWPQQNKMGDYFDMISDDLGASLAYAATFNGEQDVYFIRIGDPICPDDGRVRLDRPLYACNDLTQISVIDCGLNTDDGVIESVVVSIDSDSAAGAKSVTLTETQPASGNFAGSMPLSDSDGDEVLLVSDGDTITVTYIDADDGAGGTDVTVTATASVDCNPPLISDVRSSDVTGSAATITWNTSEPADSTVTHGLAPPGSSSETTPELVVAHALRLTDLQECSVHYYSASSADSVGNTAADDNAGAHYTFETIRNTEPSYPSGDTPLPIPDSSTMTSTIPVADDETVSVVKVEINVTHTYAGDLDITLISPTGTRVLLVADRGGSGANFINTVFDDEATTPISTGSTPFTGSFQPEEPLSGAAGGSSLGDWVLEVTDDAGGDTGTLNSWTLILTYPSGLCGPGASYQSHALAADLCPAGAGDSNGFWDAGEQIQFDLAIKNNGTDPLTGVTAQVSPQTVGVILVDNVAGFADIAVGDSAVSLTPYSAQLPLGLACGGMLEFSALIRSDQGSWTRTFAQESGEVIPGGDAVAWSENFDAAGIPVDWTVVDGLADGHTWFADDATDPSGCASTDPNPPLAGVWAAADSDCAGSGVVMDEELITPLIDLTGILDVTLQFDHYFDWLGPEKADVDVRSSLTGGAWVNVARWLADTVNPEHAAIDISTHAAGVADLQIRWHYYDADYEWFWYVDNVTLTYPSAAGCNMPDCIAAPPGPPPVPAGSPGTAPLTVDRLDATGTRLELTWDGQCSPVLTNVIYGPLDQVASHGIAGSVCAVSDPQVWDPAPPGDLWFLLVGTDGTGVESSWGLAQGAERNGLVPSGTCGTTVKQITESCP